MTVRVDTSSRSASSRALSRACRCSNRMICNNRSARTICNNMRQKMSHIPREAVSMNELVNDPRPMLVRALDQTQAADRHHRPRRARPADAVPGVRRPHPARPPAHPWSAGSTSPSPAGTRSTSRRSPPAPTSWAPGRSAGRDSTRRWPNDAVLGQICKLPWGTLPGAAAIAAYTGELTTHSWDLAKATNRIDQLDDDAGDATCCRWSTSSSRPSRAAGMSRSAPSYRSPTTRRRTTGWPPGRDVSPRRSRRSG